jgi:hypothetical protein
MQAFNLILADSVFTAFTGKALLERIHHRRYARKPIGAIELAAGRPRARARNKPRRRAGFAVLTEQELRYLGSFLMPTHTL